MLTDFIELKKLRERCRITQAELAEATGMHIAAITRIESGNHDCRVSTLKKINDTIDIIVKSRSTGLILKDENDFKNTAYRAIIAECEELEHNGMYRGNGHHLAQRLVEMLFNEFSPKDEMIK